MERKYKTRDLLSILAYGLVMVLSQVFTKFLRARGAGDFIGSLPSLVLAFLLSIMLYLFYREELGADYRLYKRRPLLNILIGLAGVVGIHLLLKLSRDFLNPAGSLGLLSGQDLAFDGGQSLGQMALVGLLPMFSAFIEEVIFRKLMIARLAKSPGAKILGLILSSFLFGLIHYYNLGSVYNTIPYMLVGLYFGLIYMLTGNIFYSLSIHFLNNFMLALLPLGLILVMNLMAKL